MTNARQGEKFYIRTYGCQMNEQDSLHAGQLLRDLGMAEVDLPEDADLVLLNTCSVREKPVHKVVSDLGRLKRLKTHNPKLLLGVMGCVAQQEKDALRKRCPELDLVLGPDHLSQLGDLLDAIRSEHQRGTRVETTFLRREDYAFVNLALDPETLKTRRAFVNIMKGCDNMCSFCIVPYVRGREVSRNSAEILTEIDRLLESGVEDITLLGQNVNSYGRKSDGELSFTELLYAIADRARGTRMDRLRFTTSHPKDVGDDLIRAFSELECLAPHFHLPVQAGSNRVLQLMRRAYTRESYVHSVAALRKVRPDIAITTDLIVGFPGETKDDFNQTVSLMDEIVFDGSFSFLYSPRPHTGAIRLEDTVPLAEKRDWLQHLQERQRVHSLISNEMWIGKTLDVLVESEVHDDELPKGRTAHNRVIHMSGCESVRVGERVRIVVDRATPAVLYGTRGMEYIKTLTN